MIEIRIAKPADFDMIVQGIDSILSKEGFGFVNKMQVNTEINRGTVFVAYYNLLNVGQTWISTGRVSVLGFVFGLHGGVLAISLIWLFLRHMNWSWRNWMPLLRPAQRTAT